MRAASGQSTRPGRASCRAADDRAVAWPSASRSAAGGYPAHAVREVRRLPARFQPPAESAFFIDEESVRSIESAGGAGAPGALAAGAAAAGSIACRGHRDPGAPRRSRRRPRRGRSPTRPATITELPPAAACTTRYTTVAAVRPPIAAEDIAARQCRGGVGSRQSVMIMERRWSSEQRRAAELTVPRVHLSGQGRADLRRFRARIASAPTVTVEKHGDSTSCRASAATRRVIAATAAPLPAWWSSRRLFPAAPSDRLSAMFEATAVMPGSDRRRRWRRGGGTSSARHAHGCCARAAR